MTTKTKTLTQTQINAICKKLKREFDPAKVKTGKTANQMCDANEKYLGKLISGLKIPAPLKKFLKDDIVCITDSLTEKELKTLGVPHRDPFGDSGCEYKLQQKHDAMIEDLKFELTMSDADDYKRIMDEFKAKFAKAITK